LIFLRFAEVRFTKQRAALEKKEKGSRRGSRLEEPAAYHADGIICLAPDARFDFLLKLPEGANIGSKFNDAMRAIERDNPQLAGVLPKSYELFTSSLLKQLLKRVSEIPATLNYDAFGRVYEYFLGEFARTEGQKSGEFYTPSRHEAKTRAEGNCATAWCTKLPVGPAFTKGASQQRKKSPESSMANETTWRSR
jgi:type I restriction enzyme M protein